MDMDDIAVHVLNMLGVGFCLFCPAFFFSSLSPFFPFAQPIYLHAFLKISSSLWDHRLSDKDVKPHDQSVLRKDGDIIQISS